jgi:hypothetical protein
MICAMEEMENYADELAPLEQLLRGEKGLETACRRAKKWWIDSEKVEVEKGRGMRSISPDIGWHIYLYSHSDPGITSGKIKIQAFIY